MARIRDPGRIILTALSVVLSSSIGFGQTLPPLRGVYPLGMNSLNSGHLRIPRPDWKIPGRYQRQCRQRLLGFHFLFGSNLLPDQSETDIPLCFPDVRNSRHSKAHRYPSWPDLKSRLFANAEYSAGQRQSSGNWARRLRSVADHRYDRTNHNSGAGKR